MIPFPLVPRIPDQASAGRGRSVLCRKRPFATHRSERRQTSPKVCRIPCLILCLGNVSGGTRRRADAHALSDRSSPRCGPGRAPPARRRREPACRAAARHKKTRRPHRATAFFVRRTGVPSGRTRVPFRAGSGRPRAGPGRATLWIVARGDPRQGLKASAPACSAGRTWERNPNRCSCRARGQRSR